MAQFKYERTALLDEDPGPEGASADGLGNILGLLPSLPKDEEGTDPATGARATNEGRVEG
jgi:hypothetical protein